MVGNMKRQEFVFSFKLEVNIDLNVLKSQHVLYASYIKRIFKQNVSFAFLIDIVQ